MLGAPRWFGVAGTADSIAGALPRLSPGMPGDAGGRRSGLAWQARTLGVL